MWDLFKYPEVVVQRHSVKKVFLEISQNSQENTCTRVAASECLPTLRIHISAAVEINKEVRCAVKCKIWPQHANFLYTKDAIIEKAGIFLVSLSAKSSIFHHAFGCIYVTDLLPEKFLFSSSLNIVKWHFQAFSSG